MMPFALDARFLAALTASAQADLGSDHPVTRAARAAHRDPAQGAGLQAALDTLTATERDGVLHATHRRLREDVSAIWALLPGAAQAGGMH